MEFWQVFTEIFSFTGIKDQAVWQGYILGGLFPVSLFIIISKFLISKTVFWFSNKKLFSISTDKPIIIYLTPLKALDDKGEIDLHPKYVVRYPKPTARDMDNICQELRLNIDPVWAESDGLALSSIQNVLGFEHISNEIKVQDLVRGWDNSASLIFSVGFNPKTADLMQKTEIDFEITQKAELKIKGSKIALNSILPKDAGVIQKTVYKGSPIFILAGLGTNGTNAAARCFKENYSTFAKMYGGSNFCVLIDVNLNKEGKDYQIIEISKEVSNIRKILFYRSYIKIKDAIKKGFQ